MQKILWSLMISMWLISGARAGAPESTREVKLVYKAYWGGFVISEIYSSALITPDIYQLDMKYKVSGVATLFSSARNVVFARGAFAEDGSLKPLIYENRGNWGKNSYYNKILFRQSDGKVITHDQQFTFDEDVKYIPVQDDLKYGPDLVSFYLGLMFQGPSLAWSRKRHASVFDGFFLYDIAYNCPVIKALASRRSAYNGDVVVCQFREEILDGRFEPREEKKRKKKRTKNKKDKAPDPVQIWFARVGALDAMLPVYSTFDIGWGKIRVYLSEVEIVEIDQPENK